MPSLDSAPFNGDHKLGGPATRAYFRYGWGELRRQQEPPGVQQWTTHDWQPGEARSPYRVYADTLMRHIIAQYAQPPAQVVDIGCGPGLYAKLFKAIAGDYHGVDIEDYPQWAATLAQAESENWPLQVHFYPLPGEELGTLPLQATFSLSSSALEHVNDPDAVIRGLAQISQPGAYGLHIVPAPWSLLSYGKHGWRRFSAQRLQELFAQAGFETVALYRIGGLPSHLLFLLWVTGLEEGLLPMHLTFGRMPHLLNRAFSLFRFSGMRTSALTNPLYSRLLRWALYLDSYLPTMAVGYAILVKRN
jgi:SAM-dependent methyltransferase